MNLPTDFRERMPFLNRAARGEIEIIDGDGTYREVPEVPEEREAARRRFEERVATQRAAREREQAEREDRQRRERDMAVKQGMYEASGVLPRYRDFDLRGLGSDLPTKYVKVADLLRGLIDRKTILVALIGPRGTGKTALASGAVRDFCRFGRPALYTRAADVFVSMKQTWTDRSRSEADILRKLQRVSLLVLDEAQVRAGSPWEQDILTGVIDARYASMLPTIMVSNLTAEAFKESIGDSISSRFVECGKVIKCDWPSFRATGTARVPEIIDGWPPVCDGAKPTGMGVSS